MTDKRPDNPASDAASQTVPMLALDAELSIRKADALRTGLLPLVDAPAVTLDASDVARVDTAAMQVLAAFAAQRGSAGHMTDWQGADGPMVDAARMLGLCQTLGLHQMPAANEVH